MEQSEHRGLFYKVITMEIIAYIYNDYKEKFGIPRQSGLVKGLRSEIVFEAKYRKPEAFRYIEGFTHLWLIWQFSESKAEQWSPLVRPPRLGGNKYVGVFASRSPFRPNPIGLSCVELVEYKEDERGPVLVIDGADLKNGTPIYDIKPYLPYADSHPEARDGFAGEVFDYSVQVEIEESVIDRIPEDKLAPLKELLSQDPRPAYHRDENRIYGFAFSNMEVKFTVKNNILSVVDVEIVGKSAQ